MKQEVLDHWSGANTSAPSNEADAVLKFVGPCDWIAAIAIDGRHASRSSVCAAIAVVVTIDTLGLGLDQQTAKSLRALGDRVGISTSRAFSQYEGASVFYTSTSFDVPNTGGKPGAQAKYLHDLRKLHADAGKALQEFVDLNPSGSCPNLMRRWIEAMYWFGQARRQKSDFIALVKIGIALDVPAKGGKYRGILALPQSYRQTIQRTDRSKTPTESPSNLDKFAVLFENGRNLERPKRLEFLPDIP